MQSDIQLCRIWIPKVRRHTASGKDNRECYRDAKKLPKNADEIRNAFQNRHCMPKGRCQKPNAKECKHDLSFNQHTEKVMKYKKKTKEDPFRKVNMLQCPRSLKQMNFKTECFSSLPELL